MKSCIYYSCIIIVESPHVALKRRFGAILLAGSVFAAVFMFPVNKKVEYEVRRNEATQRGVFSLDSKGGSGSVDRRAAEKKAAEDFKFSDALKFPLSYRILTLMCLLIYGILLFHCHLALLIYPDIRNCKQASYHRSITSRHPYCLSAISSSSLRASALWRFPTSAKEGATIQCTVLRLSSTSRLFLRT